MIKDLKELQALLKLCRKQGVTEINLGAVLVKFGDLPLKKQGEVEEAEESEETGFDALTPEQQMFLSAGGVLSP